MVLEQRGFLRGAVMGSGSFFHNLHLSPVCTSGVTTFQEGWVMVDHMLHNRGLSLVARLQLPRERELGRLRIPSHLCPSDHFSLVAKFSFS